LQVPSATYRIQFHSNFKFADAEGLIPYLHELGASHLYSSPYMKARRGSEHGYDVADPLHINAELGTEQEVNRLVERLRQHGMGLLLDIVPNHMAASPENPWWMHVLENGRESGGRNLKVKEARPKTNRSAARTGGGRGRSGFSNEDYREAPRQPRW